ncbi:hypothetical protein B0T26DRAFT_704210 [Lasiosphaeria miniovina]|uniref:Uncharacterized protein n=1 Tax=Lasiosphaeria miniovina TaxID=1954250 RepID=A0AA40E549_9PEZI|nr:uncharacterized protein B0T26DRAFT_704210 [Lasiosphaeria miniovina]KAK0722838.1 hypothetical protein B0T26DRAFT_704210 [Lasiosphaeria miniovina]
MIVPRGGICHVEIHRQRQKAVVINNAVLSRQRLFFLVVVVMLHSVFGRPPPVDAVLYVLYSTDMMVSRKAHATIPYRNPISDGRGLLKAGRLNSEALQKWPQDCSPSKAPVKIASCGSRL